MLPTREPPLQVFKKQHKNNKDMAKQTKQNPLQEELASMHDQLEAQRKMREDQLISLNMDRINESIESKAELIAEVLSDMTPQKAVKRVMRIVQDEIIRAAGDALWCPNFSLRPNVDQDINIYVNTHWIAIDAPVWKYFVVQCAERCGVPHDLMMDSDFKKKLINNLASNIFRSIVNIIPEDEVWLNMPDETLVIKSDGSVSRHPHRQGDLFYYCLSYCYDPKAECPIWHATLDRVLPEKEAQLLLAEYFCYTLMRTHRYERMLWLFGPGQNGKSTVLNVFQELLGVVNISTISMSLLTKDQKIRYGILHKKANVSSETGRDVDPDVLKQLVSGEKVTMERKYHDAFQTDDYGKFIVATNTMPVPEDSWAFYRRMILMPFQVVIPDEEKDTQLIDKLKEELPGILNWVLAAFPGLVERNEFTKSKLCDDALQRYMARADSVSLFVEQMCEKSATPSRGSELFAAYKDFSQFIQVPKEKKAGRNDFYDRLKKYAAPIGNDARMFYLKLSV